MPVVALKNNSNKTSSVIYTTATILYSCAIHSYTSCLILYGIYCISCLNTTWALAVFSIHYTTKDWVHVVHYQAYTLLGGWLNRHRRDIHPPCPATWFVIMQVPIETNSSSNGGLLSRKSASCLQAGALTALWKTDYLLKLHCSI